MKIVDGSDTVAEYEYDGAKRRTLKKSYAGGTLDETRHLYYTDPDRWQVIEERVDSSTDADPQFVWGLRYVDDLVLRDHDTTADGSLDERLYGMQDANWNVTSISNSLGVVQERFSYDPYGTAIVLTGAFGSRSTSTHNWETRFCGYRWDSVPQLLLVRHRALHAGVGGWLQRDPLGLAQGANLYGYVASNPIRWHDPSGLTIPPIPIGSGIVLVLIVVVIAGVVYLIKKLYDICEGTDIQPVDLPPIDETDPRCPPCPPPPPPYTRFDRVPPSAPHFPCPDDHTHIVWYETNQVPFPDCRCFHNRREYVQCH